MKWEHYNMASTTFTAHWLCENNWGSSHWAVWTKSSHKEEV